MRSTPQVRDLLKARPNSVALFVPSEITSYAFYDGQEKQRMVANAIFRCGGKEGEGGGRRESVDDWKG